MYRGKDWTIKQYISKDEGRALFSNLTLADLEYLTNRNSMSNKQKRIVTYNSMKINTCRQISLLSLFNDSCPFCGCEFTHFAIVKNKNSNFHIAQPVSMQVRDKLKWFNLDHVIPSSKGGRNKLENLQLSCRDCNSTKGNKQ